MKPDFLTKGDGLGREWRPAQVDYLTKLQNSWNDRRIHAVQAQPGFGKSAIARAIQRTVPNTVIITPTNVLIDQYVRDYVDMVSIKGRDHYAHIKDYTAARKAAKTNPYIANPLSNYYFMLRNPSIPKPSVVVVDEAHKLADMLLLTVTKSFPCSAYGIPLDLNEAQFLAWLSQIKDKLYQVIQMENPTEKQAKLVNKAESLYILWDYLQTNLHTVKIGYEVVKDFKGRKTMCLVVKPLQLPTGLLKTIFGNAKLVLMSGTLSKFDLEELFPGEPVEVENYDSTAPVENRLIHWSPGPSGSRSDVSMWAVKIRAYWEQHGKPNTLVHVTYELAERLRKEWNFLYTDVRLITHDKETKATALELFKSRGGILLGCGMAEGVDLPGDLCRMIVIPKLFFPNLGDDAVKKRLAMPNGQEWYEWITLATTIQQLGRGVRGEADKCTAYIFDPLLKKLMADVDKYVSPGLKASIRWN